MSPFTQPITFSQWSQWLLPGNEKLVDQDISTVDDEDESSIDDFFEKMAEYVLSSMNADSGVNENDDSIMIKHSTIHDLANAGLITDHAHQQVPLRDLHTQSVTTIITTNSSIAPPVLGYSTFKIDDVIDGIWHIVGVLNPGMEGEVYRVIHTSHAIKAEYILKLAYDTEYYENYAQLQNEYAVYTHLNQNLQKDEYKQRFPRLISHKFNTLTLNIDLTKIDKKYDKIDTNDVYLKPTIQIGYFVISKFTSPSVYQFISKMETTVVDNKNNISYKINQEMSKKLAFGYLEVVRILHTAGVVHLDSHTNNVFMGDIVSDDPDSIYKLKMIDLGRARIVKNYTAALNYSENDVLFLKYVFINRIQEMDNPIALRSTLDTNTFPIYPYEMYYFDYMFVFYVLFGVQWNASHKYVSIFKSHSHSNHKDNTTLHNTMKTMIQQEFCNQLNVKNNPDLRKKLEKDSSIPDRVITNIMKTLFADIRANNGGMTTRVFIE